MKNRIIAALIAASAIAANSAPIEDQTDQVLIKFGDASPSAKSLKDQELAILKSALGTLGFSARHLRTMDRGIHVLKLDRFTSSRALSASLAVIAKARGDVAFFEPDLIGVPVTSDPKYWEQWSLFDGSAGANVIPAWSTGATGSGVVIAIVDTGLTAHDDLFGQTVSGGYDFVSNASLSRDGDSRDANPTDPGNWRTAGQCTGDLSNAANSSWHGTMVGSIAAAGTENGRGIAGVAQFAKLLSVRVSGACGAYQSDLADGVLWAAGGAVSGVPQNSYPARVVNVSIAGDGACPSVLQYAVSSARAFGATVVAGAGNKGVDVSSAWPANCTGAIAVAAIDMTGQRWVESAQTASNYGSGIALSAPGVSMWVATNDGSTTPTTDTYKMQQGTSLAAPVVSGSAALMLSVNPGLNPDDVSIILKGTAKAFPATCSGCGSGIVNATAAVNAVRSGTPQGAFTQAYITRTGSMSSTLVLTNTGPGWITGIKASCTQSGASITTPPQSALGPNKSTTIISSNSPYSYTCGFRVTGNNVTNSPYQNGAF
ncbi:S8 family serine peptidase [Roseateles sp. NT4]|uniref:S8 family serine peptidase n=1 Tax=Roseateles sp. NT4 TaxID=3453715 RepID=UPI003EEB70EA